MGNKAGPAEISAAVRFSAGFYRKWLRRGWRARPVCQEKQRKTHKNETPIPFLAWVCRARGQTMQDIQHTCPPAQSCAVGPRGLLRGTRQERQKYGEEIKDKSRKMDHTKARTTKRENRNPQSPYLKIHLGIREGTHTHGPHVHAH